MFGRFKKHALVLNTLFVCFGFSAGLARADGPVSLTSGGMYFDDFSVLGGSATSHPVLKINEANLGGRSLSQVICQYDLNSAGWRDGRVVASSSSYYVCEPIAPLAFHVGDSLAMRVVWSESPGVLGTLNVTQASLNQDTDTPTLSGQGVDGDYYSAPDGNKYIGSRITVSFDASDSTSGIRDCSIYETTGLIPNINILPVLNPADSHVRCSASIDIGGMGDLNLGLVAKDMVWHQSNPIFLNLLSDHAKPHSQVQALSDTQSSSSFNINFTANDGGEGIVRSGVKQVQLYYFYRASSTSTWGAITPYSVPTLTSPINFTAPQGNGEYAFVTRATDNVNNIEDLHSTPDAWTVVNSPIPSPTINLSATSISFGSVNKNTTSASQTLTVSNNGNAPLSITAVNLAGANPALFNAAGCVGTSVAVGASCNVVLNFTPTAVGNFNAILNLVSDAGNPSVNLSGAGVDPSVPDFDLALASPATLSLGRNATSAVSLTVNRRNGFSGDIVVTLNSSNAGITADALTIPASATTGTLTLHTNNTIETNTYAVTIIGTSSALSHSINLSVGVDASITPPPPSEGGGCSLAVEPSSSFALFSWIMGLLSLLAFRVRR